MSASVSSTTRTPSSNTSIPPAEASASSLNLRDTLQAFIHGAPEDEKYLYESQRETAEALKTQALALFTPQKLYQLQEAYRAGERDTDTSELSFMMDPHGKIREMKQRAHAGIGIQSWTQRESTSALAFLRNLCKSGSILWDNAPEIPSKGIKALHAKVSLFLLQEKEFYSEILQEITGTMRSFPISTFIRIEGERIEMKRRTLPVIPSSMADLVNQKEEKLIQRAETDRAFAPVAAHILEYKLAKLKLKKREEKFELVKSFQSYLQGSKQNDAATALKGAKAYLDHLVDEENKQPKPEGNPEDELMNLMRMMALHAALSDDDEGCPVQ